MWILYASKIKGQNLGDSPASQTGGSVPTVREALVSNPVREDEQIRLSTKGQTSRGLLPPALRGRPPSLTTA